MALAWKQFFSLSVLVFIVLERLPEGSSSKRGSGMRWIPENICSAVQYGCKREFVACKPHHFSTLLLVSASNFHYICAHAIIKLREALPISEIGQHVMGTVVKM